MQLHDKFDYFLYMMMKSEKIKKTDGDFTIGSKKEGKNVFDAEDEIQESINQEKDAELKKSQDIFFEFLQNA